MAVTTSAPVHRLSVEDVYAMVRAEILDENARVELVEGVLVDLNPIGPEHRSTVRDLTEHFVLALAGRFDVAIQDMLLTTDHGYRLPDLVVTERTGRHELPETALLVIEVAQTSHARDREKAADYARIDVDEYWIVDLEAEQVTVHRGPSGPLSHELERSAFYRSIEEHRDGAVTPALDGVPPVSLDARFGRA